MFYHSKTRDALLSGRSQLCSRHRRRKSARGGITHALLEDFKKTLDRKTRYQRLRKIPVTHISTKIYVIRNEIEIHKYPKRKKRYGINDYKTDNDK